MVLVAYATGHGSTRGIAGRIAGRLQVLGVDAEARAVADVLGDEESMFPPRVASRLRAWRKETPELTELRQLLRPREHRSFAGAAARSRWPATGRAFFLATGGRYGDHRNWQAIDAWTDRSAAASRIQRVSRSGPVRRQRDLRQDSGRDPGLAGSLCGVRK